MKTIFIFPALLLVCSTMTIAQHPPLHHAIKKDFAAIASPNDIIDSEGIVPIKFVQGTKSDPSEPKPAFSALGRCDDFLVLQCGGTVSSTTVNAGNDFNVSDYNCFVSGFDFPGPDRLIKVIVTQKSSIRFVLDMQTGEDLDAIMLTGCDSNQDCMGFTIENNIGNSIYREVLDVNLNVGTYYIVIDSYSAAQAGTFTLSMDCQCDCSETVSDQPGGSKLFADDLEDYVVNKNLTPQSTRWRLWDDAFPNGTTTSDDAPVKEDNFGNQYVNIRQNGNINPDLVYLLDAKTTGRYRTSWQMQVLNSKSAYFSMMHTKPDNNGNGFNLAFEVLLNSNGTGGVYKGSSSPFATFSYPIGAWFNVAVVVDLDENVAEMWVNGKFVDAWTFKTGSDPKRIDAMNFYANPGNDFNIDNICYWEQLQNCSDGIIFDPTYCIENGQQVSTESYARCRLYTSAEWEYCQSVCDFGGTNIYRGDNYSGSLDASDQAPGLVRYLDCVDNVYVVFDNDGNPFSVLPDNLYADIYLFYNQNGDDIGINWDNNGNESLQCFVLICENPDINCAKGQKCILQCPSGQISDVDLSDNPCNSFFYIVITGEIGDTYSNLNIIPTGNCVPNPPVLTCGATPTSSSVSTSNNPNGLFQSTATSGEAYENCYNGPRAYTGGEKTYKFTLDRPNKVTVKLTSSSLMGMFLYPFVCGATCIDYVETTTSNTTATLQVTLNEGSYYLVVDKSVAGGNLNFTIELDCQEVSPFTNYFTFVMDEYQICPTNATQTHQVAISSTARTFAPSDQVQFRYPDDDGYLASTEDLSYNWGSGGASQQYFNIEADLGGDTTKCSYTTATNDTFAIWIWQTENGRRTFRECEAIYTPVSPTSGTTATDDFTPGAVSRVAQLIEKPAATFATSTSTVNITDLATVYPIQVTTNFEWQAEENAPWLSVNPTTYDGIKDVSLTVNTENPSRFPRSAIVKFYAVDEPNKYRQFVRVEQRGKCLPASVSVSTSSTTLCAGESLTLTANPGPGLTDLYRYKWSTSANDTLPSFTFTPSTAGNINYSVTITDKYCDRTATNSKGVTVFARPNAPTGAVNQTICEGDTPVLSVNPGGANNTVNWYVQASGGPILQNTTGNFTPVPVPSAGTYTYYAEAKNSNNCLSQARTPVTLTVNPLPTVNVTNVECEPGFQTYKVTFTTSASSVSTSAGAPVLNGGLYTKSGVAISTPLTITATATNTCVRVQTVAPPDCQCPPLPAPQPLGSTTVAICAGEAFPIFQVSGIGADETAVWYNATTGAELSTSSAYMPNEAGSFLVKRRSLINPCEGNVGTLFTLTVHPLPNISLANSNCAPNLLTYNALLNTNATTLLSSSGIVGNGPNTGTKLVNNVEVGTDLILIARIDSTGCETLYEVQSPECPCPVVNKPAAGPPVTVCAGTQWPALTVTIAANQTADWYDQPVGGQLQTNGYGTKSFVPLQAGTYFAETRDEINGCRSTERVPVKLTVNELPALSIGSVGCDSTYQYYLVPVTTTGSTLTATAGIVVSNGPGNYVVQVPEAVPSIVLNATSTNIVSCSTEQTVTSPGDCLCPTVDEPTGASAFTFCEGQSITPLTANVGPNETIDWYSAAVGGTLLASDTFFYFTTTPKTVYAQARDLVTGCVSGTRKAVALVINTPATATILMPDISPASVCANQSVQLNGAVSGAASATWSDGNAGGTFSPSSNQLTDVTYTPPPGIVSLELNLLTADPAGPCPAASDNTALIINSLPVINVLSSECNQVTLQTYSVKFTTSSNTSVSYNLPNIIQFFSGGVYTVEGIPKTNDLVITGVNAADCATQIKVEAPPCLCGPIATPIPLSSVGNTVCAGTLPLPGFSVILPTPNTVANWHLTPTGGDPVFTGVNFSPPSGGVYYVEARNPFNECVSSNRLTMTLNVLSLPVANAGFDQPICRGQQVTLVGSGAGTNGTYKWSNGQTVQTFSFSPANSQSFILTVTDANSCSDTDTVQVKVNELPVASISVVSPIKCFGNANGVLQISATSGTLPYSVSWSNGLSNVPQINNLTVGAYSATVTDGAMCKDTAVLDLPQPTALVLADTTVVPTSDATTADGLITALMGGGTPPYTYVWLREGFILNDQIQPTATNLLAGNYQVSVTDANGCTYLSDSIKVIVPTEEAYLSKFIEMFPNPANEVVYLRLQLPFAFHLGIDIFDATGRLVHQHRMEDAQDELLELDFMDQAAGLYFVKLDINGHFITRRLVINR